MQEKRWEFFSEGHKLVGSKYRPDEGIELSQTAFLINSGFTGLNIIHPARFARALTAHGHLCYGFDYRGFGESDGTRGHVLLEEQISDIRSALSDLSGEEELRDRRLVLVGWGMGGGLVLQAARNCPNVDAIISCNGFFNARRVQVALRGRQGWEEFLQWLYKARRTWSHSGEHALVDPFHIYPLDPQSEEYVDNVLRKAPGYDGLMVWPGFADSLINFAPERDLDHLRDTPLLIAHGAENKLHPRCEAESLYARYPGPATLHWLEGAGHTEWMRDDDPTFQGLIKTIRDWIV